MRIALNRESGVPLYRQIEAFLRRAIESGALASGARLPSTRELARTLGVNRITVETAYAELRADGLLSSRAGSGNYVQPPFRLVPAAGERPDPDWPAWQKELPVPGRAFSTHGVREALAAGRHADAIDFSAGIGDHKLFPVDDLRKAVQSVLRRSGTAAMDYGEPNGYAPLRRTFSSMLASQGLSVRPDNILITTGAQQAMNVVARLLTRPGDVVAVERPSYPGALHLFRMLGLRLVEVPSDERGMQVEALEEVVFTHHPRLIYTMPTFHNPTGVTLSSQRRAELVEAAGRYGIPILEDDYVGDLRYEGRAQPALKAIDPGGRVIYIGTFSKLLMPGLRVGFLVADGPAYRQLTALKQAQDLATSNLVQRSLEAYLSIGRYQEHISRSRRAYRRRRDAMIQAVREHLPDGTRTTTPQGGLFLWLRLAEGISASGLLPKACAEGVAFMPGTAFFADPAVGERFARLNFACQTPARIEEGIKRLGLAMLRSRGQ